ncbi:MAG: PEP-CTERM sorting domain-containing protein [Planctomycetia bacterium]|nr:PEP-CTERM sorting domain-containing protein [Planctomycetia bacterium]
MNSQRTFAGVFELVRQKKHAFHERTPSRPWRLASGSGGFAGCAALIIGILLCPAPAPAGMVSQSVTAFGGGGVGTDQLNVTVSSLLPLILQTENKDEAFAQGVLNGPAGTATINVHACSSPPNPGPGGTAGANVVLDFADTYQITSTTLPIGTPVFVTLIANGARQETTVLDADAGFENSFNVAGSLGGASISFQLGGVPYSFPGSFSHRINLVDGDNQSHDGLFNGVDSQQLMTLVGGRLQSGVVSALVGDFVFVGVSAEAHSQSSATYRALADADAQMVLSWGIHPFDSSIQIVNVTYPGEPVPDNSDLTLDALLQLLPPRPPTVPGVPEPGTLILLGQALAAGLGFTCWRRRRSRSSQ